MILLRSLEWLKGLFRFGRPEYCSPLCVLPISRSPLTVGAKTKKRGRLASPSLESLTHISNQARKVVSTWLLERKSKNRIQFAVRFLGRMRLCSLFTRLLERVRIAALFQDTLNHAINLYTREA